MSQATKTRLEDWDIQHHLQTPQDIVYFLEAAFEGNDASHIAVALGEVARSKGMTIIAERAQIPRDTLYKALSESGNPTLSTLIGVLQALGLRLAVEAETGE